MTLKWRHIIVLDVFMGTMLYTFAIGDGVMKNQKKSEIDTLDFFVERDIRGEEKQIPEKT